MNNVRLSRLVGQHEFWLGLLVIALIVGLSGSTDEVFFLSPPATPFWAFWPAGCLWC